MKSNRFQLGKAEKIELLQEQLLYLIAERGTSGFTIASLAKKARVSRPWIYKFFGKQKMSLVRQAALYLGKRFSEIEMPAETPQSKEELMPFLHVGSEQLILDTVRHPYIVILYFKHMGSGDPIGEVITEIESEYLRRLSSILRDCLKINIADASLRARLILVVRMGLVYSWLKSSKTKSENDPEIREALKLGVEKILQ